MAGVGLVRLGKELKMLTDEPPPGVCAWPVEDCITHLQAQIQGPEDTPYERGTFLLDLQIPERYPFEPPKVRFVTPIYHPNIDSGGRICLDTLKMRPAGSWAPSMNVPTLLTTIRLLMAHPNGDDGLMPDITELFLKNPSRFADVARAHAEQHARQQPSRAAGGKATDGPAEAAVAKMSSSSRSDGAAGGDNKEVDDDSTATTAAEGKGESRSEKGNEQESSPSARADRGTTDVAAAVVDEGVAGGGEAVSGKRRGSATPPRDAARAAAAPGGPDACVENSKGEGSGEGGGGASSDDGAWSDSDDGSDGPPSKRARSPSP